MTPTASLITATGTELAVIHDIEERQKFGLGKYGVTVADNPLSLREWLEAAYQECTDQAVYLKRAMEEMDKLKEGSSPQS